MQIADSLTRGRRIFGGDAGPKKRQKVLYIDLVLTDKQFAERYFGYKFANGLILDKPLPDEDLFEFVAMMVTRFRIQTVIIDDLSRVSQTEDGTKETLQAHERPAAVNG